MTHFTSTFKLSWNSFSSFFFSSIKFRKARCLFSWIYSYLFFLIPPFSCFLLYARSLIPVTLISSFFSVNYWTSGDYCSFWSCLLSDFVLLKWRFDRLWYRSIVLNEIFFWWPFDLYVNFRGLFWRWEWTVCSEVLRNASLDNIISRSLTPGWLVENSFGLIFSLNNFFNLFFSTECVV